MNQGASDTPATVRRPTAGRWRSSLFGGGLVGGILAGLVFLAVWSPAHEPIPHLPTSDLYTHLTVTRHLARGEGFKTDVTYPLSFAFPFARELPQPLIHRQPGFAVLLTGPYLAGGADPGRVLDRVRAMQLMLLGMIVAVGTGWCLRKGNPAAVPVWLVLLYFNPLLVFAVDWGMVELVCGLLLMILWLRVRDGAARRPGWPDGILAGLTTMLRLDLVWVPLLWWALRGRNALRDPASVRRLGLALLAWLVITAPWAVRNLRLTGNPVFSLQSYAEHVKDTRDWPGYTVYRQLEPQALGRTLTSDPVPVLRKAARGLKFHFRHLPRLVPLPVILVLVGGALWHLWRRVRSRGPNHAEVPARDLGPMAAAVAAALCLAVQYSVFDHSLRHLLVVLPVLLLEFAGWLGSASSGYFSRIRTRFVPPPIPLAPSMATAACALLLVLIFPCRLPGWQNAAAEATAQVPLTAEAVVRTRDSSADVLFVSRSAIPWFIDRPVVWNPGNEATRLKILELLNRETPGGQEKP